MHFAVSSSRVPTVVPVVPTELVERLASGTELLVA